MKTYLREIFREFCGKPDVKVSNAHTRKEKGKNHKDLEIAPNISNGET